MQALRYVRVRQQIGHDHDAVHRRANFVAHGGDEVGLGAIRLLGGIAGGCKLARAIDDFLLERFA